MANRNINQLTEGYYQIPVEAGFGSNIDVANTVTAAISIELNEIE
jgi:hypothetical protein